MRLKFNQRKYDHSLFIKKTGKGTTTVLIYVDDILITEDNLELIKEAKKALQLSFQMKDLRELKYFLGIEFSRSNKSSLDQVILMQ